MSNGKVEKSVGETNKFQIFYVSRAKLPNADIDLTSEFSEGTQLPPQKALAFVRKRSIGVATAANGLGGKALPR